MLSEGPVFLDISKYVAYTDFGAALWYGEFLRMQDAAVIVRLFFSITISYNCADLVSTHAPARGATGQV